MEGRHGRKGLHRRVRRDRGAARRGAMRAVAGDAGVLHRRTARQGRFRGRRSGCARAFAALAIALPAKKITVNLSPADLPKEVAFSILAIALGVLAADREIVPRDRVGGKFVGLRANCPSTHARAVGVRGAVGRDWGTGAHSARAGPSGRLSRFRDLRYEPPGRPAESLRGGHTRIFNGARHRWGFRVPAGDPPPPNGAISRRLRGRKRAKRVRDRRRARRHSSFLP